MDTQELRNLQEAYLGVYASPEELDEGREGGRFEYNQIHGRPYITPQISQSQSSTGTLGGVTYISGSRRLPNSKRKYDRQVLTGVRAASVQERERARRRMGIGENYDLYDIILSHLLDEGYADTIESAEAIMVNMSEDWSESIIIDEGFRRFPKKRVGEKIDSMYKNPKIDIVFGDDARRRRKMMTVFTDMAGGAHPLSIAHSPKISKAASTANRNRPESQKRSKTVDEG